MRTTTRTTILGLYLIATTFLATQNVSAETLVLEGGTLHAPTAK